MVPCTYVDPEIQQLACEAEAVDDLMLCLRHPSTDVKLAAVLCLYYMFQYEPAVKGMHAVLPAALST